MDLRVVQDMRKITDGKERRALFPSAQSSACDELRGKGETAGML